MVLLAAQLGTVSSDNTRRYCTRRYCDTGSDASSVRKFASEEVGFELNPDGTHLLSLTEVRQPFGPGPCDARSELAPPTTPCDGHTLALKLLSDSSKTHACRRVEEMQRANARTEPDPGAGFDSDPLAQQAIHDGLA